MKVYIDSQIFLIQKYGGISHYFAGLIKALRSKAITVDYHKGSHINFHLKEAGLNAEIQINSTVKTIFDEVAVKDYDIYHSTYYLSTGILRKLKDKKYVTTIHDMIPEYYPDYFLNGTPHLNKEYVIKNVDACVSVSMSTTKDVIDLYKFTPPIETIRIGISEDYLNFPTSIDNSYKKESPYFIYIGNRLHYKNFECILKSLVTAKEKIKDLKLICVGNAFNEVEKKMVDDLKLNGNVINLNLSDKEIMFYTRNALALVTSSFKEGFNIPILQSLALGTQVIASDIPAHREFGDQGVFYFDPNSHLDLAFKLINAVEQGPMNYVETQSLRSRIREEYSWGKIVDKYIAFYSNLMS
jgi:glycosyltransferase involved in cell wall biosynthesis